MEIRLLTLMGYIFGIAAGLALAACAVVSQDRFGELPKGERLDTVLSSPNYKNGKFENLIPTPKFSKDAGLFSVLWSGLVDKTERLVPDVPIPVEKTDLKALSERLLGKDAVVWLGHSSWLILVGGKRILVDPVLSTYAAPFSFLNKAFPGTSIYTAEDMPKIDCLLISHDHWDHLDYPTVAALKAKVKQVVCPLGVGGYFESWGYPKEKVLEGDWYERISLGGDVVVHVLPARHYSGRLFKENKTLWAGFAIDTPGRKIFYSGDSGYGPHFSKIGKAFNGFDLVLLDCGQYDPRWAYIHMTPEEAARAAGDLDTKAFIPAHVGRFSIANHPWDEPFNRLAETSRDKPYLLLTPRIGEPAVLGAPLRFANWWTTNDE